MGRRRPGADPRRAWLGHPGPRRPPPPLPAGAPAVSAVREPLYRAVAASPSIWRPGRRAGRGDLPGLQRRRHGTLLSGRAATRSLVVPVPRSRPLVDRQRRPAGSDQGSAEPCARRSSVRAQAAPGRWRSPATGRRRGRRAAPAAGRAAGRRGRPRPRMAGGRARRGAAVHARSRLLRASSRAEGVSNTILEAMATRLPIVATRVSAATRS